MPQIIKPKIKKKTLSPKVKPKKKPSKTLTLTRTTPRSKPSPTDYYNCLLNYSQQGFYDESGKKLKIHACCKKCKLLAPSLNSQRDKELVKLISSYQQVGDSLKKLLRPLS